MFLNCLSYDLLVWCHETIHNPQLQSNTIQSHPISIQSHPIPSHPILCPILRTSNRPILYFPTAPWDPAKILTTSLGPGFSGTSLSLASSPLNLFPLRERIFQWKRVIIVKSFKRTRSVFQLEARYYSSLCVYVVPYSIRYNIDSGVSRYFVSRNKI